MCVMVAVLFGLGSLFLQTSEQASVNKSHQALCIMDQNSERLMHIHPESGLSSIEISVDVPRLTACMKREKEKAIATYRRDAMVGMIGAGTSALIFAVIGFHLYRQSRRLQDKAGEVAA
jgi:hypothetical protein